MSHEPAANPTLPLFPELEKKDESGSLRSGVLVRPLPLSSKQKALIEHCHICGKITLDAAVELIGRNIYNNAGKHVGATLSTMVKRRLLVRIRPGVFVLPNTGDDARPLGAVASGPLLGKPSEKLSKTTNT